MLSRALRVGHRTINNQRAREKRVEARAQKQAPMPVEPVEPLGSAKPRYANPKQTLLGAVAVGAHLLNLGAFLSYNTYVCVDQNVPPLGFTYLAMNVVVSLSLLSSGGLFFVRRQRLAMLISALSWMTLFQVLPTSQAAWPCVAAAIATLAAAFALGRKSREEPEAPTK